MSDRTVTARLRADTGSFIASMKSAQSSVKSFHDDATKSAAKNKQAWEDTGKGMAVAGGVIAAGVGLAVKNFMDFDAAMSQAQAGTMATGASLDALRAAAIDAGAKTQYSATEAAQAITAMGKAGVSTKDILNGGLNGALALAAAGQLEVGEAAEIAATAMNQFGLEGKDIPHIADLLAAGAGKAMGSVQDLAGALKYAGVVASDSGWSIEETTGVLAEFAQAGIKGEQAGTSLRGILSSLSAPSEKAAGVMEDLGISMYDTNGNFLKAAPLAQLLKDKLGPLSNATRDQALGQIFGNEQLTAARVLYSGGGGAVSEWTKNVNDAGYATKQAAMLTDNLSGDVERLGGSLSSVLIQSGSGANGMLRTMTQQLQGAVDLYGSAPVPVQQAAAALGAVAAAGLLLGGGLLVLLPRIEATKIALGNMGRTGALASTGMSKVGSALMGPVGVGLALGTVALGYFANQARDTAARVDELATSLDQQTGAITENTTAMVSKRLSDDGTLASAKEMGVAVGDVTAAYLGNTGAIARVDAALQAYGVTNLAGQADVTVQMDAMDKLTNTIHGGNTELNAATAKNKLLAETQKASGDAAKAAIDPTTGLTGAVTDSKKSADDAAKAYDDLKKSIEGYGGVTLDARGAARDYQAALDDATKSVKDNGVTLDTNTVKGRANQVALENIRTTALKTATANFENGQSLKSVTRDVMKARDQFITMAMKMGASRSEANKLADQLGLTKDNVARLSGEIKKVPTKHSTTFTMPGLASSREQVQGFYQDVMRMKDKTWALHVAFGVQDYSPYVNKAAGGAVYGAGTGTSDSINVRLSNNEHVWTAREVHAAGGHGAVEAMRAGVLRGYKLGGEVVIGTVTAPSQSSMNDAVSGRIQGLVDSNTNSILSSMGGSPGGAGGAARWAPMVLQVLAMLGQASSWLPAVLSRINQESGGNPNAINNWDSNAAAGYPSQGLMQTIPGTFAAYAGPFRALGITNPLASIYAGLSYAISRYGGLGVMTRPGGYAGGTDSATPGWHVTGEDGPELVKFRGGEKVIPNHKAASLKAHPSGWVNAAASPASGRAAASYSLGEGNQFYSYDPTAIVAEQRKRAADAAALYNIGA